MGYISFRRSRLEAALTRVQTRLTALYVALDAEIAIGAESYQFDSGEGSQRTTRRSIKELRDCIREDEATESHLINELNNMGILSIRLRRTS